LREKPSSFDVMTKGDVVRFGMPRFVKEHSKVMGLGVDDVLEENLDEFLQAAQCRVVPAAQEVGVGLEKVEVRVHGFLLVHVALAQALLASQCPIALVG